MHRTAWDKKITTDHYPLVIQNNPSSPYYKYRIPLFELKEKGVVQTSCLPALTDIQLLTVPSTRKELHLKLSATGVTFLGHYNEELKKWETAGSFKKRYTGSSSCAVDAQGRLWLNSEELKSDIKGAKPSKLETGFEKQKKKPARSHPDRPKFINYKTGIISTDEGTISEQNMDLAKKTKTPSYRVNKSKVRQRLLTFINTQKGKKHLFFWTVTFPAHTPDSICYQAFNTWLTSLRQYKMLKDYLWVAERQLGERLPDGKEATGTIHFHIAIPHYMNVERANSMMRGTLKNLAKRGLVAGAVCNKASGTTYYLPSIARYNGVHITKNHKTGRAVNFAIKKGSRALASYLTKYVTKNDETFIHLAWHNSRGFSANFTGITCTIEEFNKMGLGGYLNRMRVFKMNFATFIPWLYGPPNLFTQHLYEVNSKIQTLTQDG